jgi:hypothetical protein
MLAAAAVVSVVLVGAVLVALVPRERVVPVLARRVLERRPVLADLVPGPAVLVPADLAVLEDLVLEPAVPVPLLLSRRSFSAAMASSSRQPGKPR